MVRKNILIDKPFQLKFAMYSIVPILLIDLCFWVAIEFYFNQMANEALIGGLKKEHDFFKLLQYQKVQFIEIIIFFSLVVGLIMTIWSLYISHRIAGPLRKFEKNLIRCNSLDEAKSYPIEFRKDDFFKPLASSFNEFIRKIS
jgi:hypothetical protein